MMDVSAKILISLPRFLSEIDACLLPLCLLHCLRNKRATGDMIETYKYQHNVYDIDNEWLKPETSTVTRGHTRKLIKPRCNSIFFIIFIMILGHFHDFID